MKSLSEWGDELRVLTEAFKEYNDAVERFESETGIDVLACTWVHLGDVRLESLGLPVGVSGVDDRHIHKHTTFNDVQIVTLEDR